MNSAEIRKRQARIENVFKAACAHDAGMIAQAVCFWLAEIAGHLAEAREANPVKIAPVTLEEAAKIEREYRRTTGRSTRTAEDMRDAINRILAERAK